MKDIYEIQKLISTSDFNKKIQICFGRKTVGEDFDSYEKNYTRNALNPITIKGLVRFISPQALVWKKYGLMKSGSIQIYTHSKYKTWFEQASKVLVDREEYTVYNDGSGNQSSILELKGNIISIVLERA